MIRPLFLLGGFCGLALVGGCAGVDPAALGLTGAPLPHPPALPDDATIGVPGVQTSTPYAPSLVPRIEGPYFSDE